MTPTAQNAPDLPHSADVVVVGAGISGLVAARELVAARQSVIVLEARDRVGGRLRSWSGADGARLDLGATWFWPGEARVACLVGELGIRAHEQYLKGDAMYHSPDGAQRLNGNPLDGPSLRFSDGAASLAEAVAADVPAGVLRLGHAVTAILAADDGLTVETTRGRFSAHQVILAAPPSLAASRITFTPALPRMLAGLASVTPVWMGSMTKVVARYATPFWREAGLSGSATSHVGPVREIHDMSGPAGEPAALFGFVPGASGEATVTQEQVVRQFTEIFGEAAAQPLDVAILDWRDEEWTTPPGSERQSAYQVYGHPLYGEPAMDGRLHWASTETSAENPGHIEGAIAAAFRAVGAILEQSRQTVVVAPSSPSVR